MPKKARKQLRARASKSPYPSSKHSQSLSQKGNFPTAASSTQQSTVRKETSALEGSKPWPPVPFKFSDPILLVGEGDFSFSRALLEHHACFRIFATTLDSREESESKYITSKANTDLLRSKGCRVEYGVDATKLGKNKLARDGWKDLLKLLEPVHSDLSDDDLENEQEEEDFDENNELDEQRRQGKTEKFNGWGSIIFNFPHVGGLSTDVNRQVRHNQELIVSFLKAALTLLSSPANRLSPISPAPASNINSHTGRIIHRNAYLGQVLLTTFEAHPYTLWNVKDLARHCEYSVERSWKFVPQQWKGYSHKRTLGDIEGGGGWKGEERSARVYCLRPKEGVVIRDDGFNGGKAKKRQNEGESDSETD
jgi:25S rRNA (uracil2634-N3)-methyltransferase